MRVRNLSCLQVSGCRRRRSAVVLIGNSCDVVYDQGAVFQSFPGLRVSLFPAGMHAMLTYELPVMSAGFESMTKLKPVHPGEILTEE
jgi:hypothetical protein